MLRKSTLGDVYSDNSKDAEIDTYLINSSFQITDRQH